MSVVIQMLIQSEPHKFDRVKDKKQYEANKLLVRESVVEH